MQAAAYFLAGLALLLGGYSGLWLRSELGWAVDAAAGVALAALTTGLGAGAVQLIARWSGRRAGSVGTALGALLAMCVLLRLSGFWLTTAVCFVLALALPSSFAVGGVAAWVQSRGKGRSRLFHAMMLIGVLASGAATAAMVGWLLDDGLDDYLAAREALVLEAECGDGTNVSMVGSETQPTESPAARGTYRVKMLTYGSGTDVRRPEYADGVALRTPTVDVSPFCSGPAGLRGRLRNAYWGFGLTEVPLNARVWLPDADGVFPLVILVHGNRAMQDAAEMGFEYLAEPLASRGYIVASIDQNFLNRGGLPRGAIHHENDARAWLTLKHLAMWRKWTSTAGNPFHGRVDMSRIALVGHSRGGEAVYHAAVFNRLRKYPDDADIAFDFGFAIRSVISLAPTDGQYRPADRDAPLDDVNYLVLQGGHDADVASFLGDRAYERVRLASREQFKASVYIHRGNHAGFNTTWRDDDLGNLRSVLLNRRPLLPGKQQRAITSVCVSAFLDATLLGKHEYRRLFANPGGERAWLPATFFVKRFEAGGFRNICDFQEDVDPATTSLPGGTIAARGLDLWKEGDLLLRGGERRENSGVFLGWRPAEAAAAEAPVYEISLPSSFPRGWSIDENTQFQLDACQLPDSAGSRATGRLDVASLDFSLELVDASGAAARLPLSRFGCIPPPLQARLTRCRLTERRYGRGLQVVLQTIQAPLAAFAEVQPEFRPQELRLIRLVFDRSPRGSIVLDRLGFTGG